jgi:hypothetical protein
MTKMEELYYKALVDKHGTNFKVCLPLSVSRLGWADSYARVVCVCAMMRVCDDVVCVCTLQAMARDIKLNYNQLTETKLERRALFYIEAYRKPDEDHKRKRAEFLAGGGKNNAEEEDDDDDDDEEDDEEDGEEDGEEEEEDGEDEDEDGDE